MSLKQAIIGTGFSLLRATRAHRLLAPLTRGMGVVLTFHRVRPALDTPFQPNRLLEITPEFLAVTIDALQAEGFDILSLDAAMMRLADEASSQAGVTPPAAARHHARPFAVLTFDDGYRDFAEHALPVLRARHAPFTLYITSGFADGSARLWWVELEQAIASANALDFEGQRLDCASPARKQATFEAIYWRLRSLPETELLQATAGLCAQAGVDPAVNARDLCMGWDELRAVSADPLCTLGAHTATHPRLATCPEAVARAEIVSSRAAIQAATGRIVRHFCYPVGDRTSAGPREFALAREAGFVSAVTTRPGMVFAAHAAYRFALPRMSVNGLWQDRGVLEALLSGAPFALWNKGRRLNVA